MNARLECPTCKCQMTAETHFERWMRNNGYLKSSSGLVRFDCDVLLHRYMVPEDGFGKRDVQAIMAVEVKTYGRDLDPAQRDTFHLLNQVLRNRKPNINASRNKWNAKDHAPLAKAWSIIQKKHVALRMYGMHVLTFEKNGPEDSEWIKWDKSEISEKQLLGLLAFELNPDDPRLKLDIRRRSKPLPLLDQAEIG